MIDDSKRFVLSVQTGTVIEPPAIEISNEQVINNNQNPDYFIGIADIMGFKNLIRNPRDGLDFYSHMEKIHLTLEWCTREIQSLWDMKSSTYGAPVRTRGYVSYGDPGDSYDNSNYWESINEIAHSMYFFSDTIFYCLKAKKTVEQQIVQLRAMCQVMNSFIVLPALYKKSNYQIINRGGIAFGPAYIDLKNKIFFGDPIINAYELSEAQQWMGAAIHHSVNKIVTQGKKAPHFLVGFDAPLIQYNVPLKRQYRLKNKDIKFALNWYQSHRALPEYKPEIRQYLNNRPLWTDVMDGNILRYNWDANEDTHKKMVKTIDFAKKIEDSFNRSRKYCKVEVSC